MNVALVRLAYSDVYGVYRGLPKKREIRPPLGLLCIAGALEEDGHHVTVLDAEPKGMSIRAAAQAVQDCDVVGVTATTPEFHNADEFCRTVKELNPQVVTVVGGPHVSALPVESQRPWIDFIVTDEGEVTLPALLRDWPPATIVHGVDADLSRSRPARHLLDYRPYYYPMPGRGLVRMDVVESSRGCPFRCEFCFNRARPTRYKDPAAVADEIAESEKLTGARLFMFLDDTLTARRSHILALCDEIQKRGLHKRLAFFGNARANCAQQDVLEAMRDAHFVELSLGVESGDQGILDGVCKGTKLEQYQDAYHRMRALGFQTRGSFILGLPGETHETARRTIDFAKSLELMRASCNVLTPYPGTKLLERARQGDGLYLTTEDWSEFKRWGDCVVHTDELSCDDLLAYQRRFLTEFYSQPKVLAYHAREWLRGNRDRYFYRPLLFALNERRKAWGRPSPQ